MAICILNYALHSTIQMKLYRAAIIYKELCYSITLLKYQANGRKPMQQAFIFLRVHQYALIEQSVVCVCVCVCARVCVLYGMMQCINLIHTYSSYSSTINISGVCLYQWITLLHISMQMIQNV